MERPKSFIIIKFLEVVKLMIPEVNNMYYRIDSETKEEYVRVEYRHYDEQNMIDSRKHFDICVTCDSNEAMLDDVWRELKRRFL